MPDPLTLQQRHLCMSHIRSKDTSPEMKLRRELWRRGYRYRTNVRKLPGTPDIVLGRYRSVIFVNGCFWHGHEGCRKYTVPKSRARGLPEVHGPQEQRRVLEGESRPQPGARPAQQPAARVNRLERDHGVGMRARESTAKRYGQPHRSRA